MEIKIGLGLDNLIFGMLQEDVIDLMGEPDKISDTEKENGVVYYYNDQLIKVKFDQEEGSKLYAIEAFNQESVMFDNRIMNKDKREIVELLKTRGYHEIEEEEYTHFETVFCREIWSTFMFEFNRLRSVEFSPLFENNDRIIWPEIEPKL